MLRRILAIFTAAVLACCATICAANKPAQLKVVSLNTAVEPDVRKVIRDLERAPQIRDADLFLLQEVSGAADGSASVAEDLAERLGMRYQFAPADQVSGGRTEGLAIVSRHGFRDAQTMNLQQFNLHFKQRKRIAMAFTLESPAGAIRVFNVHLDSRINKAQRLEQLAPLLQAADDSGLPCLIGGDFNTSNFLFVGHAVPLPGMQNQVEAVRSAMTAKGFSTPFGGYGTFAHHLPLRLDWIYLRGLSALASGVADMPSSDHRAIWVTLSPTPSRNTYSPRAADRPSSP